MNFENKKVFNRSDFTTPALYFKALNLGGNMKPIDIFLDDVREKPKRYDVKFETAESLLEFLKECPEIPIRLLSLDHDLGEGIMDGYDLVKELTRLDTIPKITKIKFHTDNMTGFKNMYYYLTSAQQHGVLDPEVRIDNRKWYVVDGIEKSLFTPIGNG